MACCIYVISRQMRGAPFEKKRGFKTPHYEGTEEEEEGDEKEKEKEKLPMGVKCVLSY
jgi:hypothetical protein